MQPARHAARKCNEVLNDSEPERIITVFGSSRPRENHADYQEAVALGRALGEAGFAVCSGGYGGVMEAVSRGARDAGAKTYGVTAEFFKPQVNRWVETEIRVKTWQERLFELVRMAHGFVACKGGTGTLVELAVVWEMLNKSVIAGKPMVVLGDFWTPILERVREVELEQASAWGESNGKLVHAVANPLQAAEFLRRAFVERTDVGKPPAGGRCKGGE
jgi:uncharacterized protein (TIGR00730 family)